MQFEALQNLGLTNNEIKVYLALLELGDSLASLISKKTNINRSLTYKILDDLIKKGFVSYVIKENRKYFSASDPRKLIDILKEKEIQIKKILPDLLKIKEPIKTAPKAEIFAGKNGMKTMLEDVLKTNKKIFILGAKSYFSEKLIYYHPQWHKRRIKQKISMKILFESKETKIKKIKKIKLVESKFLPKTITSKIMIAIYGNKVAIELWFDYPTTIVVTDTDVAEGFKNYFNLLWELSK